MANPLFDETMAFGQPGRVATTRQPGQRLVQPVASRPGPAPPVAPTLGGGSGLGVSFNQPAAAPGSNLVTSSPSDEAESLNPMGGPRQPQQPGQNLVPATPPAPEVIRGTTQGAGDVHPSWQLYHNAGRGEDYPGAVAAFRRSQGEGALKTQEGEATRTAEIEKARIAGQAHVDAMAAYSKDPGKQAVEAEQLKGLTMTNRKTEVANNQATLRKQLEEEIGTQDPKTGNYSLPTDPALQGVYKKMDRLAMQGVSPEESYKAIAPELHKHFYTPENVYGAIGLMEKQTGRPLPPELRAQLMSGTPEAMATLYPFTRQAAQQPRGVVSRTLSPAPTVGPGQPSVPAAAPASPQPQNLPKVMGSDSGEAPQPGANMAQAAEMGDAAGTPQNGAAFILGGPKWGKPLGGAMVAN